MRPFVEDLGRVREELGAERVRRELAEKKRDELRLRLEAALEAREAPETPSEEAANTHRSPIPETPFTEEEPRRRRSWWREFFGLE